MLVPNSRHQLVSTGALSDQTGCSVRFSDSNAGAHRQSMPRRFVPRDRPSSVFRRWRGFSPAPSCCTHRISTDRGQVDIFPAAARESQQAPPCVCARVQRQVTPNLEMPPPLRNRSRVCEAVDCLSRMYSRKRKEGRHAQGGHLVWRTRLFG